MRYTLFLLQKRIFYKNYHNLILYNSKAMSPNRLKEGHCGLRKPLSMLYNLTLKCGKLLSLSYFFIIIVTEQTAQLICSGKKAITK